MVNEKRIKNLTCDTVTDRIT